MRTHKVPMPRNYFLSKASPKRLDRMFTRRSARAAICRPGAARKGAGDYPALADNPKLAAGPYVTMMVLDGHAGMPGFGDMLDDRQVAEVVSYVRTHFGNDYAEHVTIEDVKSLRH